MTSVQSIDRAFDVLDELANRPAGISELARRVGLPTSTASRLLKTLERLHAAERDPDGVYHIGPAVLDLASRVQTSSQVRAIGHAQLVKLSGQIGEVAGLSVRAGDDVLYVDQTDSHHEVRVRDWTGERVPMHVVSSGLVFLAHIGPEDLDDYLGRELERFTDRTQYEPHRIRERLADVKRQGYVWTNEEFHLGINSIAAPLYDASGEVIGALHSHGPSYRFPKERDGDRVAARLVQFAAQLSHDSGWAGHRTQPPHRATRAV